MIEESIVPFLLVDASNEIIEDYQHLLIDIIRIRNNESMNNARRLLTLFFFLSLFWATLISLMAGAVSTAVPIAASDRASSRVAVPAADGSNARVAITAAMTVATVTVPIIVAAAVADRMSVSGRLPVPAVALVVALNWNVDVLGARDVHGLDDWLVDGLDDRLVDWDVDVLGLVLDDRDVLGHVDVVVDDLLAVPAAAATVAEALSSSLRHCFAFFLVQVQGRWCLGFCLMVFRPDAYAQQHDSLIPSIVRTHNP